MMIITDDKLTVINAARAARGLPPLTKQEAIKLARDRRAEAVAQSNHSEQSSEFLMHYLIGYATGIPFPSTGGIIGAAMHYGSGGESRSPRGTLQEESKPDSVGVTFNEPRVEPIQSTATPEPSYSSSSDSGSLCLKRTT